MNLRIEVKIISSKIGSKYKYNYEHMHARPNTYTYIHRGDRGYMLQGLLVTVALFLERPLLDS